MRKAIAPLAAMLLAACGGGGGGDDGIDSLGPGSASDRPSTSFNDINQPTTLQMSTASASESTGALAIQAADETATVTLSPDGDGSFDAATFNVDRNGVSLNETFGTGDRVGSDPNFDEDFVLFGKENETTFALVIVHEPIAPEEQLTYTRYGIWAEGPLDGVNAIGGSVGAFAGGFETPGAVPTSGSATYVGQTIGTLANIGAQSDTYLLDGRSTVAANFAEQSVTSTFDQMEAAQILDDGTLGVPQPWNSFTSTAAITGNDFAGEVDSITPSAISPDMTEGGVVGTFFGPNAEEVGGTWLLTDDDRSSFATGSFGAKRQ